MTKRNKITVGKYVNNYKDTVIFVFKTMANNFFTYNAKYNYAICGHLRY